MAPGEKAPNFNVLAFYNIQNELKPVQLDHFSGQYTLLFFFPGGTPVCASEILAFSGLISAFQDYGCAILGCTVSSPDNMIALRRKSIYKGGIKDITFPMLCDENGNMSKNYGVLGDDGNSERAILILDQNGTIRFFAVYDRHVGRNALAILDMVKSYSNLATSSRQIESYDKCPEATYKQT